MRISIKKQRNIGLSKLSLTGTINSVKENRTIEFESSLERDFLYLLEYDDNVISYCEQPIKIFYLVSGREIYYVPDFYVEYKDGRKEIIEVKYSQDLIDNKDIYEKKFSVAKSFCEHNNIQFIIKSEIDIRTPLLDNAKFYYKFTRPNLDVPIADIKLLLYQFKDKNKLTVEELLTKSASCPENRGRLQFVMWYLLCRGFILYDKTKPLKLDSILKLK